MRQRSKCIRGFSLVELLVAIGIMTLITGVVLTQFSNFDSAIIAKARAYDMAQAVRATQSYATRVRTASSTDTDFALAYGIQFMRGSGTVQIFTYRGTDDPQLDQNAGVIEYRYLPTGYTITALCFDVSSGAESCAPADGATLSISFRRPDITSLPYSSWYTATSTIVRSRVGLRGPGTTLTHWIAVEKTGALSTYVQ